FNVKMLIVNVLRGLFGLACAWLLANLGRCNGDQLRLDRLAYCEERLGKLPSHDPELLILRDLFQTWLSNRRVEFDMEALREKIRNPPTSLEDQYAWKTSWNESYVIHRIENAKLTRTEIEAKLVSVVRDLREKGLIEPTTNVQDLVHCTSGHLQPRLFPDQPLVSFMLQYFKRPRAIDKFVTMLQACNNLIPSEFLINVDSPQEGQQWADLSWSTNGFVIPVMSFNVHELRGYNRLAGVARGKYMVLLQDDDLIEPADCSWLPKLVNQFEAMPTLAMVGLNRMQLSHGEGNDLNAYNFMDPNTTNNIIFAFQVDLAPLAIRRSAYKFVGGLDEGMSDPGECGIWSDWELSIRFWTAGWHVAYMPLIRKAPSDPGEVGGTHKSETGVRCWGRQQGIASTLYMARWGAGWGSGPGKFLESLENYVRIVNLKVLKGLYTQCPFRKGCDLEGDPPLPERFRDYKHEDRPMVQA
ncbi:hypothetical protein Vretifemale_20704, partial [Volvox reticuliferus]